MLVCNEIQQKIDVLWHKLQHAYFKKGIRQIDLDLLCLDALSKLVQKDPMVYKMDHTPPEYQIKAAEDYEAYRKRQEQC